ncbi:sensor histidine kinase [uncultured Robinsoniella sp.]|uniref:cache domain-containing sensor histidine kinase n=1 Tax=uncultured Robinsoniella sp. TaxID=904190 RepID=UPI00374E85B4
MSAGRRLSTRVTAVNTLISLIGFIIMGMVLGVVNYRQSIAGEEQKMGVYLANSLSSADNKLKDMARVSMMCYSDEKTQDILKSYGSDTYRKQLASEKYLNALYTSLITIREDIDGVYIFDADSLIMANDTLNPARKLNYDIESFIREMETWEMQEGQINGCIMRLGTQPDFMRFYAPLLKNPLKNTCLYLVREVNGFSPNKRIGHIVLTAQVEVMQEVLEEYLDGDSEFSLITDEGDIVCDSRLDNIGKNIEDGRLDICEKGTCKKGTCKKGQYLVSYQTSEYSSMTLIIRKPMKIITGNAMLFMKILSGLFFALVAVTVFFNYFFTKKTLRPLLNLSHSLESFDPDKMNMRFEVEAEDEVGQLIAAFNQMMDRINELIQSEYKGKVRLREAQLSQQKMSLLYLKNQINPHFLYNTLDTIRLKSELNGDMEVAEMILMLVDFFRLSVKVDSQIVSIAHEVKLVQAYLGLMSCRYPNLRCTYDIDQALEQTEIPNFILQPIVENSVMHGLRNKGYRGTISLLVQVDEVRSDYVKIMVSDDGVGMEKDAWVMVEQLLMEEETVGSDEKEDRHIGIKNVQKRLKMYYPLEQGLIYRENLQGGVTVTFYIKNRKGETE